MSDKNNKICIICGKYYHYCPSCRQDNDKPTWYNIFDGENCKNIYDIVTSYRDELIDEKKANEEMSKCDINNLKDFNPSFKKYVDKILADKVEEPIEEVKEVKKTEVQPNVQKNFTKKK